MDLAVRDKFVRERHIALAIQQYQDATAEEEGEFNDEEAEYDLSLRRSPYLVHQRGYGRDGAHGGLPHDLPI